MGISIALQLIVFPVLYSTNYLTYMFQDLDVRFAFRALQSGLDYSVYSVYFLRCLRVYFAHETSPKRKNTLAFRISKDDYKLAIIVVAVAIMRALTVTIFAKASGVTPMDD